MPALSAEPTQATSQMDNPAALCMYSDEGQPPFPAQLAIRETTNVQWSGVMILVPPAAPRYLLVQDSVRKELRVFDLLRPASPGVAVLCGDEMSVYTAALSADGDSICLGCYNPGPGGLSVYDTAPLLAAAATLLDGSEAEEAEEQVVPRARAPNIEGQGVAAGAAFSHDADRLFVLWLSTGGVTVHDPWQPSLPVLRRLPFRGPSYHICNSMLACAGGLLAAAAGGGLMVPPPSSEEEAKSRRKVQLWQVDAEGETELRTLSNPDLADSVALSPNGCLVAVGLQNGAVRLTSPVAQDNGVVDEDDLYLEVVPVAQSGGNPIAHTLCFSHDGSKLVVGRAQLEDFTVYDVGSAAVVSRFVHSKSMGFAAAFFPMSDVLVTGTVASGQQCVFHRLLPPAPRFELLVADTGIACCDVASGGELGSVVAVVAGSELIVRTLEGKRLLHRDLDEEPFTSLNNFRTAVRMQPGGKLVAYVLAKKTVVVVSVADGSEILQVIVRSCMGMWWSPDGGLLAVATSTGARVFARDKSFAEIQCLDDSTAVYSCAFDSTGARLATGRIDGRLTIWEIASWAPTRTIEVGTIIFTACFSNNGDRLAYQELDGHRVGVLSLEADNTDEPLVEVENVNALSDLTFSPDDNFLLCCPSAERPFDQHRMRVLDLATGTDAQWGELLRTMALPVAGGTLSGRTLGWAEMSQPASHTIGDSPIASQWVLYGAVGNRFVATDIDASLRAIEDGAWTADQLVFCSEYQQELVGSMVAAAPHCSNIRDTQTGETVLHRLMRARQAESLQKWLDVCPDVAPVADDQGLTAVQVAVQLDQLVAAQALWQKMPGSITSISASLVMDELRLLSQMHPHFVRAFLLDVEPAVVRTLATFRTELARAVEIRGLSTATLFDGSNDDKLSSHEHEGVTNKIPSVWSDKCPADSLKQVVAWKVVVLPELLGGAESASPFHEIVAGCNASVFDSKLLELIVQYKWEENVRMQRMWSVAAYGCACVIGTTAMLVGVTSEDVSTDSVRAVDVLQGLVVIIEVSSLGFEAFQLVREGVATYFTGPWNTLDVASSSLLLAGSAYHFLKVKDGLRIAGAVGAALKCFGMIDYLRSFSATGSLVRMISVILMDMIPFMTLLTIAMLGNTIFFAIHQSRSDSIEGLFSTLVTVYHMALGIGQGIDTSNASVMTVVVVTAFTSFVVVVLLNLLIAIMGDSYEKVKENERVEAIRERARIVVEMEKRFPTSHHYHSFMHFVEVADAAGSHDIAWEGATRRVTEVMRTETRQLNTLLNGELKGEMGELNTKISLLDGELKGQITEMKGEMSKMKDEMSEINSKLDVVLASLK